MPKIQCPRCQTVFCEGYLLCTTCGLQLNTSTDLRKACQVIRIEELARLLGFEMSMDLFGDDVLSAKNSARGNRGPRSSIAILKTHAADHLERAGKMMGGLYPAERLEKDPFYSHNCARSVHPAFIRDDPNRSPAQIQGSIHLLFGCRPALP